MALRLGNVKPWVLTAANEIAGQYGITDVGGWRAHGSVPNSDHPKGLATDFMTSDVDRGNAIAAYAQANADRLGITYVIWNRRIWIAGTPHTDWRPYNGPSPHTDHVHVSYTATPPKAGGATPVIPAGLPLPGIGDVGDAFAAGANALRAMAAPVAAIGGLASTLTKLALPTNLVRLVAGILGIGLLFMGVHFLVREVR